MKHGPKHRKSAGKSAAGVVAAVLVCGLLIGLVPESPHGSLPPRPRDVDPFRGVGTWVDVYDAAAWADPATAVSTMASDGVRTLYLQTSNYSKSYDLFNTTAMAQFIESCHANGMNIVAWYLPGLQDLPTDLGRTMAAINFKTPGGQQFDGFGMDIESTIVHPPPKRSKALVKLSAKVRAASPAKYPLGAIIPSPLNLANTQGYWPDFPYAAVDQYYDVFLPMDYFTSVAHGGAEVEAYVTQSLNLIRQGTGSPDTPVHVIGGIAQGVSPPEAKGLVRASLSGNVIGVSLYDFATTTDPAVWAALRRFDGRV